MTTRHLVLLPADDGPLRLVKADDLTDMYAAIGCDTIDVVGLKRAVGYLPPGAGDERDGWALVVDDNGLLTGKPLNRRASILYGARSHGQVIVGDVLLAREVYDVDGGDLVATSLTEAIAFLAERGAA